MSKSAQSQNYIQVGRVRSIKPEFFTHEGLFDLEIETKLPIRVAFSGLWTQCDREGRFRWQPRRLKTHILPYDECDFSRVLDALATRGFVVKYEKQSVTYGWIPSFLVHQYINNREQASNIPPHDDEAIRKADIQQVLPGLENASPTRQSRVEDARRTPLVQEQGEGKGREGNIDSSTLSSTRVSPQRSETIARLLLKNGKYHEVTRDEAKKLQAQFPNLAIEVQLQKMEGWLEANPARRKKPAGIKRFIHNWLSGEREEFKKPSEKKKDFVGNRKQNTDGSYKL